MFQVCGNTTGIVLILNVTLNEGFHCMIFCLFFKCPFSKCSCNLQCIINCIHYQTLTNLDACRNGMREFPPKSQEYIRITMCPRNKCVQPFQKQLNMRYIPLKWNTKHLCFLSSHCFVIIMLYISIFN
jgi:hypothetical protein